MMIRSAPPASAHFAESPVPAPAPMIGLPAAIWARSRASASARVMPPASDQLVQPVRHREREGRVVHVGVDLVHLDLRRVDQLADRVEQRRVGLGVVEDLALGRDRRDAAQRHEEHGRPGRRVELRRR